MSVCVLFFPLPSLSGVPGAANAARGRGVHGGGVAPPRLSSASLCLLVQWFPPPQPRLGWLPGPWRQDAVMGRVAACCSGWVDLFWGGWVPRCAPEGKSLP